MTIAWVVGSGGLLGTALCRQLRGEGIQLLSLGERFDWGEEAKLQQQFFAATQKFAEAAIIEGSWQVYWAAGVGTFRSTHSDLACETRALASLLNLIQGNPTLSITPGAFAFSSSAGAIYAGSNEEINSEKSDPTPTTAYAFEKLKQEDMVNSFVRSNKNTTALLARLSTIYGSGQSRGKQQGLLAHIARCILRNQPIQIYVPYDTIRDYIAADDAAAGMIAALCANCDQSRIAIKIIASERPTTIAEIVSIFKRITRRAPRIVTSANKLSTVYSRRVQFHSVVMPECTPQSRTSLLIGIAQILAAERAAFLYDPSPT